jgi:peptide deformylase
METHVIRHYKAKRLRHDVAVASTGIINADCIGKAQSFIVPISTDIKIIVDLNEFNFDKYEGVGLAARRVERTQQNFALRRTET